jgi:hypothetical protein
MGLAMKTKRRNKNYEGQVLWSNAAAVSALSRIFTEQDTFVL